MKHILPHFDLFEKALPRWLIDASQAQRDQLQALTIEAHRAAEKLRESLDAMPSPRDFALGLLKSRITQPIDFEHARISRRFQLDCVPSVSDLATTKPVLDIVERALCPHQTVSQALLHAALSNYPTPTGFGDVDEAFALTDGNGLSAQSFVRAVHDLDIGGHYQSRLKEILPLPAKQPSTLQAAYSQWRRAAFEVDVCQALMSGQLTQEDTRLLPRESIRWMPSRALADVTHSGLALFGTALHGALVFVAGEPLADGAHTVLLYAPNHPEGALRGFASETALKEQLVAELKQPRLKAFYLRMAAWKEQLTLTSKLASNLSANAGASYAERSIIQLPTLNLSAPLEDYPSWRNLILENAATLAVPASVLLERAHERLIARLVQDCEQLLFTAAMLVPGFQPLGWLALAVFVHGIADEVYDGYQAWSVGDREQAIHHVFALAANLAAGVVVQRVSGKFTGELQLMQTTQGKPRLWRSDMVPYRPLPPEGIAEDQPRFNAAGRSWVRLNKEAYPVVEREGALVLDMPGNHEGVTPELIPQGGSGWRWEHDDPLTWQGIHLLRAFAEVPSHLGDQDVLEALRLSGVTQARLRYALANGQPLPAVLAYWLRRCSTWKSLEDWAEALRTTGKAPIDAPVVIGELVKLDGWPTRLGLGSVSAGEHHGFGEAIASEIVELEVEALSDGSWGDQLLGSMSEEERIALTGTSDRALQALELAKHWSARIVRQRWPLHRLIMNAPLPDERVIPLIRQFPGLPTELALAVASDANQQEVDALLTGSVPPSLGQIAVDMLRDLRVGKALEALEQGQAEDDSDRLFISNLARLPNWDHTMRITLKTGSSIRPTLESIGPDDAIEQVVERVDGLYRRKGSAEPGATLEQVVVNLLSADQRRRLLGTHDAAWLRKRVVRQAWENPESVRGDLNIQPNSPPATRLPGRVDGRLGYALSGRRRSFPAIGRRQLTDRLCRLYPLLSMPEILVLEDTLAANGQRLLADAVSSLEADWTRLDSSLKEWARTPLPIRIGESASQRWARTNMRYLTVDRIRAAWRRETKLPSSGGHYVYGLDLSFLTIGQLPESVGSFDHIEVLDMTGMELRQDVGEFLTFFPNVRSLSLGGNPLTGVPRSVSELKRLERLVLAHTPLTPAVEMFDVVTDASLPLSSLDISGIGVPTGAFEKLLRLPGLQVLRWDNAPDVTDAHLATIGEMRELRLLTLVSSGIRLNAQSRGFTRHLTLLSGLYMNKNPLTVPPAVSTLEMLVDLELEHTQLGTLPEGLDTLIDARPSRLRRINLGGNKLRDVSALVAALQRLRGHADSPVVLLNDNPVQGQQVDALEDLNIIVVHAEDAWMMPNTALLRIARRLRGSTLAGAFLSWVGKRVARLPALSTGYRNFLDTFLEANNQFASFRSAIPNFDARLAAFRQRIYGQIYDSVLPDLNSLNRQLKAFQAAQRIDIVQGDDPYDALLRHNYDLWQLELSERYGAAEVQERTTRSRFVDWLLDKHDELNQNDVVERMGEQDWQPYLERIDARWTAEEQRWDAAGSLLDDAVREPVDAGEFPALLIDNLIAPGPDLPRARDSMDASREEVLEPVNDVPWRADGSPRTVTLNEDQYRRSAIIYRRVRIVEMERLAREITEAAVTPWWEPEQE